MPKKVRIIAALIYLVSQIFFLINVQFPVKQNFDEFHYVPSAKQFLEMTVNQNWEHPPLGKILMAVGIGIWGDQPLGWRFMSTVFGALTLVGMYLLAFVLFESEELALWVTILTLVNNLLYVQSRIGMLDTFMFAFLVWAMVGFCFLWKKDLTPQEARRTLNFTGIMIGLGTACKWFVIVPWFGFIGILLVIRLLQNWRTQFVDARDSDWYQPQLWTQIHGVDWLIRLGLIPIFTYFVTFLPFLFVSGADYTLSDILQMQYKMWDGQLRVVNSHPYMSHWLDWPTLKRPIWYAFDREGASQEFVRGVILLGNPLIMWTGLAAILYCAWKWISSRSYKPFLILFFYLIYYGCWMVIPRKIEFYYYYYPAGMVLSLALAYVFSDLEFKQILKSPHSKWYFVIVSAGLFIYFFPILAGLKIPAESFRKWMWFPNWI